MSKTRISLPANSFPSSLHSFYLSFRKVLYSFVSFSIIICRKRIAMPTDSNTSEDLPPEPMLTMTDYERMCLKSHEIPTLHNFLASFSIWILLAGFVVFPGTFTSLRNATRSTAEAVILGQLQRGLVVIAGLCCGVGVVGILRLWWLRRKDYKWLLDHLFLYVVPSST